MGERKGPTWTCGLHMDPTHTYTHIEKEEGFFDMDFKQKSQGKEDV